MICDNVFSFMNYTITLNQIHDIISKIWFLVRHVLFPCVPLGFWVLWTWQFGMLNPCNDYHRKTFSLCFVVNCSFVNQDRLLNMLIVIANNRYVLFRGCSAQWLMVVKFRHQLLHLHTNVNKVVSNLWIYVKKALKKSKSISFK